MVRKSWTEKLNDDKDLPKVIKINKKLSKVWGKGTCVIPAPREVDALMRKIPEGKVATINDVRARLAKKHHTTIACPITTGIFARIAAGAAEEAAERGEKNITPYWRTLKQGGVLNAKYPGGIEKQKRLLEKEGHIIQKKGEKFSVADHEDSLARL